MEFFSRDQIIKDKETEPYQILLVCGISDSDIQDQSVALGRVYCCWEPNERANAIAYFISRGLHVELGDIVEVKAGQPPAHGKGGTVNVVTQIRQKYDVQGGPIRWMPPNERLWARVLYADWMREEGWVEQTGLWKTWYKPGPAEKR